MIEIVYASAATVKFSPADLATLLAAARVRNQQDDITGVLLYHDGSFLQVLEGVESVVRSTFDRIAKDPRHGSVLLLKRGEIEERSFADWRMGFLELSQAPGPLLEGFSDFLRGGTLGLRDNAQAVHRILSAFKDGRYHPSIR